ncbi:MAG TPA: EAL domain-containing protein [Caulobacterales bacterium]|nr:EAL domain-containing protein [Caulobacterales bacterium]
MANKELTTERLTLLEAMCADRRASHPDLHIQKVLQIVRAHLDMDVGFVSEFSEGRRVFRHADAKVENSPVVVGNSDPLEESYCQRVVDGRLPPIIHDATQTPAALELPVTTALPVGAHISVPIRLPDGRLYGTFCCFSFTADHTLNERDLRMLRAFAAIAADLIAAELELRQDIEQKRARIQQVLADQSFDIVYQPIYEIVRDRLTGFEALTRFRAQPQRPPDQWFNEAAEAGLAVELEFAALRKACASLDRLPQACSLSLNLSPASMLTGEFKALFDTLPLDRIVLEITEHAQVESYAALDAALAPYRARGLRLAVDDAGAGHASFRHVLDLRPEIIKLDMSLTRDVGHDPARHALATALTMFGRAIGSQIVAEGVETRAELMTLRAIGVTKVQGYVVSRPISLDAAAAMAPSGAIAEILRTSNAA